MQNKIEIKYVGETDTWQMTVWSDIVGKQVVSLSTDQAMMVALAIGIAKDAGKTEGYSKAKKKYKAIEKLSTWKIPNSAFLPWEDAEMPMSWKDRLSGPNS